MRYTDMGLIAAAVVTGAAGAVSMLVDHERGEVLIFVGLALAMWVNRRRARAEMTYHDRHVDEAMGVLRDVLVEDKRTADAVGEVVETLPFRVHVTREHLGSGPHYLHGPN